MLSSDQLFVGIDAADISCLNITAVKILKVQEYIHSISIDDFRDQLLLVFDWHQSKTLLKTLINLLGEPLKLELLVAFPLEHVTLLIVIGKLRTSIEVESLSFLQRISGIDNVAPEQVNIYNPSLMYWNLRCFGCDYVPYLSNENFALINTQPGKRRVKFG